MNVSSKLLILSILGMFFVLSCIKKNSLSEIKRQDKPLVKETTITDPRIDRLIEMMEALRNEIEREAAQKSDFERNIEETLYGKKGPSQKQMEVFIESEEFDKVMEIASKDTEDPEKTEEQEPEEVPSTDNKKEESPKNLTAAAITMVVGGIFGAIPNSIDFINATGANKQFLSAKNIGINGGIAAVSLTMLVIGSMILASEKPSEELITAAGVILLADATATTFKGLVYFKEARDLYKRNLEIDYKDGKLDSNSRKRLEFELESQKQFERLDRNYKRFRTFLAKRMGIGKAPPVDVPLSNNTKKSQDDEIDKLRNLIESDVVKYKNLDPYKTHRKGMIVGFAGILAPAMLIIGAWQLSQSSKALSLYGSNNPSRREQLFVKINQMLFELWDDKRAGKLFSGSK